MVLIIDNYDSFSYNLVQMAGSICPDVEIVRNDQITVGEIKKKNPDHIILSPGPGYPQEAGILESAVRKLQGMFPLLGVCLGHQGICEVFGAVICQAECLMHGKQSRITIDNTDPLFSGLPNKIRAARYHSLIAKRNTIPEVLKIIGETDQGEVMAVKHKTFPIYGVQFHPESILTPDGEAILKNFLSIE